MPLSFLIKPSSSACNMRCAYCFYHDEAEKREVASYGMMSLETLEQVVKKALVKATDSVTFAFQGGEPTLAGLDFYQSFARMVRQYAPLGVTVQKSIQTNGLLIDDKWAEFFAKERFLVGLSMDGPRELHDFFRRTSRGEDTHSRVLEAARCLERHGVEFNILTVLTRQAAKKIESIYRFYRKSGFQWMQFIPCLDPLGEPKGGHPYSLRPKEYADYLKTLFDLWYRDVMAGEFVSVRYFENILGLYLGVPAECCGLMGHCTVQYVVESDGGVYPCDFYVVDQTRLGNLLTDSLEQLDQKRREIGFLEESFPLPEDCKRCPWQSLCRNGCKRERELAGEPNPGRNYYCQAYREFFEYSKDKYKDIIQLVQRRHTTGQW